jgi:1,4-dihydroxy-2-naphthoyl-CoA hydrolase
VKSEVAAAMANEAMPAERGQLDLAVLNDAYPQTLAYKMGIRFTEASALRVVGTMPVDGNTQPYGLLHGGASCVLAETLGSTGAALHAGSDRVAVGIEINATHHRAATAGQVTGIATQLHAGQTMATYDIQIIDDRGRRVCTARLSCLLREAVPAKGADRADRK